MSTYYDEGGVTIIHGDAREVIADGMQGGMGPVVIVTDPPYGIGWTRSANPARQSKAHDGIQGDQDTSLRDDVLAMLPDAPGIVFGSFYAPYPDRLKQVLVWPKPADAGVVGSVTGNRRDAEPVFLVGPWPLRTVEWSSVLEPGANSIKAVCADTGHPHTKPVPLMRALIARCPADALILDPFMGSGSTLRAAKDLGRRAVGIEIEERYCATAAVRCAQDVFDFGEAA